MTYQRLHPINNWVAFTDEYAKRIIVKDQQTGKELFRLEFQNEIAEFDFSEDGKCLIARDVNNLIKMLKLNDKGNIYQYYDNYLPPFSEEEKKQFGIDW